MFAEEKVLKTFDNVKLLFKPLFTPENLWKKHKNGRVYPFGFSQRKRKINEIILHYTAGSSSTCGKSSIFTSTWKYLWNKEDKPKEVSADFAVDDDIVTQYNPNLDHYHSFSTSNDKNGISIEMCSSYNKTLSDLEFRKTPPNAPQWYFSDKVLENTKKLILSIFSTYPDVDFIITTHYEKTGKLCPGIKGWNNGVWHNEFGKTDGTNNTDALEQFKKEIFEEWELIKNKKD